jgi:DNA-binding LacI/PurR family transcriptional regulator
MTPVSDREGGQRAGVTMADVAERAGVSVMTVSNVVNGRTTRVGPSTRGRVLEVIEQLGYRVNLPARQLRRGRTGVVALAVPEIGLPYFGELADRLSERFAEHGLRLVVERTGGRRRSELETMATSVLDGYDALVLSVTVGQAEDFDRLHPAKPVVLLGERALAAPYDHVIMDNVGGARTAVAHLLERGARRIVALGGRAGGEGTSLSELRTQGYLDAHREAGLEVDPGLVVACDFTTPSGYDALAAALGDGLRLDALFALTDSLAIGGMRALADRGLAVPRDVQVVGWDDTRAARFSVPSLTSVEPGSADIADAVVRLIVERIEAGAGEEPRVIMTPARVVERESTRPR